MAADRPCYCYIVRCADGTFYTGWTVDVQARLAAHNAGRGSRYTRARRPVTLAYVEEWATVIEARRREPALKRLSHGRKEALCRRQEAARPAGTAGQIVEE